MRGSYQWALLRLIILTAFVVPAALMKPSAQTPHATGSWLAAVELAAPVLSLHQPKPVKPVGLPADVLAEIRRNAVNANDVQQQALQQLRQQLARELVRSKLRRSNTTGNEARS